MDTDVEKAAFEKMEAAASDEIPSLEEDVNVNKVILLSEQIGLVIPWGNVALQVELVACCVACSCVAKALLLNIETLPWCIFPDLWQSKTGLENESRFITQADLPFTHGQSIYFYQLTRM